MRVAALACALAIGAGFGIAFFWEGGSVPSNSTSVKPTAPAGGFAPLVMPMVEQRRVSSANIPSATLASASDVLPSAVTLLAQGSPTETAAPVATVAPGT